MADIDTNDIDQLWSMNSAPVQQRSDGLSAKNDLDTLWSMNRPRKEEAPPDAWEDVGRSVLAKGARGVAAIPGMAGDIPALFGANTYRPPTTEEYIEKIGNISPAIKEALSYQPKTTAGKYVGSAAEFLPTALIPIGPAGLGARAIGAIGSGVGSQGAEDIVHQIAPKLAGTPYEGAAKLTGAIVGGMAAPFSAGKIAGLAGSTEKAAAERFAGASASDIATQTAKAPIAEATAQDISPIAAGGTQVQKLVSKAGEKASESAIGQFNQATQSFKDEAVPTIHNAIDEMFGRPVNAFDEMDALKKRVADVNDVNYTRVMGAPEAQAVQNSGLKQIINRLPRGTTDDVLEQFRVQGVDPKTFGLVPTEKGYAIPSGGAALRFWDEVKQNLDSQIGAYIDPITKAVKPGAAGKVSDLQGLKTDLVKILDKSVPEYKDIRYEASDIYGSRNAIEAGYKYFKDANPKSMRNIEKLVGEKLTDAQLSDFSYGFAGAYKDALEKNPSQALGVFGGKTGQFNADKMRFALGKEAADGLLGKVNAQYLNSSIKSLSGGSSPVGGLLRTAGGGYAAGLLGEAAYTGSNLLTSLATGAGAISPTAITSAVLASAGKAYYTVRERKIADQVLKLAADPAQNEKLGKLIAENQDARSFLAKFYNTTRNIPAVSAQTQADQPRQLTIRGPGNRMGRKSGGRVSDKLVTMVDRAKKNINNSTESLLKTHDNHVAQALEIANRNLEG